ncbi:MAG: type IV toxin-antitoxin system AbiEi family antitoxin domain-containing protein [Acidimicrobiales bacterium]
MSSQPTLGQFFSSQLSLITFGQAKSCGASEDAIRSWVQRGVWERMGRGVYRIAGSPNTWDQRALATCLVLGPGTALSHGAAGAIHCFPGMPRRVIEVAVPNQRRPVLHGQVLVHRPRQLAGVDLCSVGVLKLTTPARTVIDQASQLSYYRLASLVDHILCRRSTSLDFFLRRVDALAGRGRPGSALLRQVLEAWTPGGAGSARAGSGGAGSARAESDAEMHLLRQLLELKLPRPQLQHPVVHRGRVIARTDFAWPEHKLALELDSEAWHDTPEAFHGDKARTLRLASAGWEVLAVTPRNLTEGLAGVLAEALRRRLNQLPGSGGGPPTPTKPAAAFWPSSSGGPS